MTPWKKLMDKNYFGSWDIEPGKDLILTIKNVYNQDVKSQQGEAEKCLLINFEESDYKPLILNNCNCESIEKATGSQYTENWVGKKIALFVTKVSAFGEVVDAVRIRSVTPVTAPAITCKDCGKEIHPFGGMQPDTLAVYTTKKFGRPLCAECATKAKGEK